MKTQDLITIAEEVIKSNFSLDSNEWHYDEEKEIEVNSNVYNVCYDVKQTVKESISEETTSEIEIEINWIEYTYEDSSTELIYHSAQPLNNLFDILNPNN